MKTNKVSIACTIILTLSVFITPHMHAKSRKHVVISGISAIVGGALYGHILLPWYTNKRALADIQRRELDHIQKQEQLRSYYRTLNSKYITANIPLDNSNSLLDYKKQLLKDTAILEEALEFDWDDQAEKESLTKLAQYLHEHQNQITKLITLTVGQEILAQYKDELALLAKDCNGDANKMTKIVYEKFGDTTYKFTTYKATLQESIAQAKLMGISQEAIQALENLNKNSNYLFANALEQERSARENAIKQEQLFKAELANKHAIKDFYQEAQHHVQQSSQTVSKFAEEMDRQCRAQKTLFDHCHSMLQNIRDLLATWGIRSEQQTERLVYEVRQQGQATRNSIHAVNAKTTAAEQKANAAERKAEQAQQQAAEAKGLANAALPPMPPAYNPNYQAQTGKDPEPSAPPFPGDPDKK